MARFLSEKNRLSQFKPFQQRKISGMNGNHAKSRPLHTTLSHLLANLCQNMKYASTTYILLDGLVCSIVGYFYESRRILASP